MFIPGDGKRPACVSPFAMWDEGWEATVKLRYDPLEFGEPMKGGRESIGNLLLRAGTFVGIGAGRPDAQKGVGLDMGLFTVAQADGAASGALPVAAP